MKQRLSATMSVAADNFKRSTFVSALKFVALIAVSRIHEGALEPMKFFKKFRKGGPSGKKSQNDKTVSQPPGKSRTSSSTGSSNMPLSETQLLQEQVHSQSSTTVNENGNRVTTTTVRVPPQDKSSNTNVPPSQQYTIDLAATELTRALVKKFIADIWNRGEIDLIPEVCSPSLRFNGNTGFDRVGHDGLSRMVATIREALDDYHCEIHSMVVESNKAFCRLRFTGKHNGQLLGYTPTGKSVAWMGATEFTIQNGKILKVWELGDVKSLEEQLAADENGSRSSTEFAEAEKEI